METWRVVSDNIKLLLFATLLLIPDRRKLLDQRLELLSPRRRLLFGADCVEERGSVFSTPIGKRSEEDDTVHRL
jgi:hypothetical protein